jgi:hypothetical protein
MREHKYVFLIIQEKNKDKYIQNIWLINFGGWWFRRDMLNAFKLDSNKICLKPLKTKYLAIF